MKYIVNEANMFEWGGLKGFPYNSKEDFPRASGAYFIVTGSHGKVKTTVSDRIYFIVKGEGESTINDKIIPVKEKEMVIVPKNTPYDYKAVNGTLEMFLIHTPAYDANGEVKLDN